MKKIVSILIVVIFVVLANNVCFAQNANKNSKNKVKIMYFHGTNRCVTCNSVENNAKKLLDEQYKAQLTDGTITFVSYNIDEKANEALVEKYEIGFSTLLIIKNDGKTEKKTDFTDKAFQYAKNNPDKYKNLLKAEIDKNLK